MVGTRTIAPPLNDVLYTMAEEGADQETTDVTEDLWAGLMRDGADVAQRVEENIEADQAPISRDDLDPDDLTALKDAAGVIVTRDNRRGTVTARAYASEDELLTAWSAIVAELEPSGVEVESSEMDDSTEGPSSGPKAGEPV